MNQFVDYFKQTELALAAYAKSLEIGHPAIERLQNAEFSGNQARSFADNYNVVGQFDDAATGLSATVFADKVSGETFLAVRGTEINDVRDFAT